MSESNQQKLNRAVADGLGLTDPSEFAELAYGKHENWDSIAHMNLVACLESEFDIMLDTDDVIGMSSYPVAIEILKKYGVDVN